MHLRTRRRSPLWAAPLALAILGLTVAATAEQIGGNDAPEVDDVFVSVNGETLSYGDFYSLLQDQIGMEVAERLVFETVLRQEAAKQGAVPTDEEITNRVNELIEQRFGGDGAQFAQWMGRTGSTNNSLRRQVAIELMDLRLRSKGVEATDENLREYFEKNRERRYDLPERVRYRQVVLDSKERANEVLAQINANELTFFSAASRFSLDPSAVETGGLAGPTPLPLLKELAPPLYDALKGLQANEASKEPIEYEEKWYLLLLIERMDGRAATYDEVAARVRMDYLIDHAQPAEEYYQPLIDKASVVGLPTRFRLLELQFAVPNPSNLEKPLGPTPETP